MRITLLLVCALAGPLAAQTFDPFPNGSAARYHFDLARNFYRSDSAARRDQERLIARLRQLGPVVEAAQRSPVTLFHILATQDTLARLIGRQYGYLTLRGNIDAREDADARQRMSDLYVA